MRSIYPFLCVPENTNCSVKKKHVRSIKLTQCLRLIQQKPPPQPVQYLILMTIAPQAWSNPLEMQYGASTWEQGSCALLHCSSWRGRLCAAAPRLQFVARGLSDSEEELSRGGFEGEALFLVWQRARQASVSLVFSFFFLLGLFYIQVTLLLVWLHCDIVGRASWLLMHL